MSGEHEMTKQKMNYADVFAGGFFLLVGSGVLVEALRMPHFTERAVNNWTVPGIMPGFVGFMLSSLGFLLLIRSIIRLLSSKSARQTQSTSPKEAEKTHAKGAITGWPSILICLVLGTAYVSLIGPVSFMLLTFLFILVFTIVFDLPKLLHKQGCGKRLALILLYSVVVSTTLPLLFERVFMVRLP